MVPAYYREPDPAEEDYSCACCDLFYADYTEQLLKRHWNSPHLLYKDLREVIEEGFARWGWKLLNRLIELKGFEGPIRKIGDRMSMQVKEMPKATTEASCN